MIGACQTTSRERPPAAVSQPTGRRTAACAWWRSEPSAAEHNRTPTSGLAGVAGYLNGRRRAALIPQTGTRHGTWHVPSYRVFKYRLLIFAIESYLTQRESSSSDHSDKRHESASWGKKNMADSGIKRNIPIKLGDFSVIDTEFSNIRERFDAEMRKMEDEMSRFRSELMNRESNNFFKSTTRYVKWLLRYSLSLSLSLSLLSPSLARCLTFQDAPIMFSLSRVSLRINSCTRAFLTTFHKTHTGKYIVLE